MYHYVHSCRLKGFFLLLASFSVIFGKNSALRTPNTEKRILAKSCMSLYTPVAKILFSYYLTHIPQFYSGLKGDLVWKFFRLSHVPLRTLLSLKFFFLIIRLRYLGALQYVPKIRG